MLDDLGLLVIIGGLMNDDDATPETTVLIIRETRNALAATDLQLKLPPERPAAFNVY